MISCRKSATPFRGGSSKCWDVKKGTTSSLGPWNTSRPAEQHQNVVGACMGGEGGFAIKRSSNPVYLLEEADALDGQAGRARISKDQALPKVTSKKKPGASLECQSLSDGPTCELIMYMYPSCGYRGRHSLLQFLMPWPAYKQLVSCRCLAKGKNPARGGGGGERGEGRRGFA